SPSPRTRQPATKPGPERHRDGTRGSRGSHIVEAMLRHALSQRLVFVVGFALSLSIGATAAYGQGSDDDAAAQDLAEPDFVLVNLPTTLRLPAHGGNFHLSHRFNENLRQDSFSDQVSNLFGLDQGANIGLEFRFGVMRHLEAVVQRTNLSRAIQF